MHTSSALKRIGASLRYESVDMFYLQGTWPIDYEKGIAVAT